MARTIDPTPYGLGSPENLAVQAFLEANGVSPYDVKHLALIEVTDTHLLAVGQVKDDGTSRMVFDGGQWAHVHRPIIAPLVSPPEAHGINF